jgi:hypothetical protein
MAVVKMMEKTSSTLLPHAITINLQIPSKTPLTLPSKSSAKETPHAISFSTIPFCPSLTAS